MAYIQAPFRHSFLDYPSPTGACITIYFVGCNFNCEGCHNKNLQYLNTQDNLIKIDSGLELFELIDYYSNFYRTKKVCFMGGEPLLKTKEFNNLDVVFNTISYMTVDWEVCIYTGYEYDKLPSYIDVDFIKCGQYKKDLHQLSYKTDKNFVLGSKNQKLYKRGILVSKDGIYEF